MLEYHCYSNNEELRAFGKVILLLKYLCALCVIFLSLDLHAEEVSEINSESYRLLLNEDLEYFVDNENLDYSTITQSFYAKQFNPVIGDSIHQGFVEGSMWIRFSVLNNSGKALYSFLEMRPNTLDYEIYSQQLDIEFSKERVSAELPQIASFFIEEGQQAQIHIKISSDSTLNPDIFLSSSDKLLGKNLASAKINYFIISCFSAFGLLCFFLAISFKNPAAFAYGLHVLSWILIFFTSYHYFIVPDYLPGYTSTLGLVLLISNILYLIFARLFLERLFTNKVWNYGYILLISSNLVMAALSLFISAPWIFAMAMALIVASQFLVVLSSTIFYFHFQSLSSLMLGISKLTNMMIISLIYFINVGRSDRFFINDTSAFIGSLVEGLIMLGTLVFASASKMKKAHEQELLISVAEAQSSSQQNLLTKLTHELRTPLTGILGMTELLKDSLLTPNQSEQVKTIHDSGESLLELIEKVTTEVQVEAGELTIRNEKLDLPAALADAVAHYQGKANEKGIELILDVSADTPLYVNSDELRLQQVILRVLDFILQMPLKEEVVLKVNRIHNKNIRFQASFNCPTLQATTLQSLLYSDNKTSYSSLDIANHLIQIMGGKFDVFTYDKPYYSISFVLPLEELKETSPPSTEFLLSNLQHKRILAVDDNKTCLDIIEQQSRSWGMFISSCQNAQEALALLRSKEDLGEPFDLVISDYLMPGMNGIELATKIQQDAEIKHKPPILILTGVNHIPKNAISPKTGIRRVINKPLTGNRLRAILAEEFSLGQKPRETSDEASPPAPLAGTNVLVAEDNKVNAQVISTMLKKLGAEVSIAQNGQHAVEKVLCEKYDVILMDCEMPIMDGFEATRIIRKNQQKSHKNQTPIIALTAHTEEKNLEKCLAAGMNAHMSKPVSINELQDLISRTLNKQL